MHSILREARAHRRYPPNPAHGSTLGQTGVARSGPQGSESNASRDAGNLARSFSSMEEFFRDFDRRHPANAFAGPTAGAASGLGAESFVPWRHPMGDFIVSILSFHPSP